MRDDDQTITSNLDPEQRVWQPEQKLGAFKRLLIIAGVIGAVVLLATTMPQADSALSVEKVFAERPATLGAGTELQGCIDNAVHARITEGKSDWLLESVYFQSASGGLIYLDLVGDPEARTSHDGLEVNAKGDCMVLRLAKELVFQTTGGDYSAMGEAQIVRVISIDESSRSKFFKLGGEARN